MCLLNYSPFSDDEDDEEDEPQPPLPRGIPQLTWTVPVNIVKLGTSLEAYAKSLPQVTTMRLCHKFRDCHLSRLPQELLEKVIKGIQLLERANTRLHWRQEFRCFQGLCRHEDHYEFYGEHVENTWQSIFVEGCCNPTPWPKQGHYTESEKVSMVYDMAQSNPRVFWEAGGYHFHIDSYFNWVKRTCMCPVDTVKEHGAFRHLNSILRSHFGLEAIVLHEVLSSEMNAWLPNHGAAEARSYYTVAYLKVAARESSDSRSSSHQISPLNPTLTKCSDHTAFRQIIDPSQLVLSEKDRTRFPKAMRFLGLKPYYHLSELEPHVVHPIEDEFLMDICSCHANDCPASPDHKSWDKPYFVHNHLKRKSKELAKESWPKLMSIAASDAVMPYHWLDAE